MRHRRRDRVRDLPGFARGRPPLSAAASERAPSSGSVALSALRVSKRYGRSTWALRDVSVDVPRGVITALVGPNAAGKSTLIRTWLGFERPSSGKVTVTSIDPLRSPEQALAKLAYVPQRPVLYRDLTVADNVTYANYLRPSLDVVGAQRYLDQLAIPWQTRLRYLSGGQSAQVALAIALSSGAEILLLDEPLASLDPLARHEALELLRTAVRDRELTALLSSHVVRDVEQASAHLIVLGVGRVLLSSSIVDARNEHRVVDEPAPSAVGQLPDQSGWLIRDRSGTAGRPATIEEIMLGYLSQGRAGATGRPTQAP